jgi:hypothetical protein
MEFWFAFETTYHFFVDGFEIAIEAKNYFDAVRKLTANLSGCHDCEAPSV